MSGNIGKLFEMMESETEDVKAAVLDTLELTKKRRELIETSNVNASTLVKEEVYAKIMEGAEKVRCMRDVLKGTTFTMPTPSYRLILHENVNGTLPEVAPTAEYPVAANESYRAVTFIAKKYGELPVIEEELISDAMFDIVEMRLKDVGKKAENTLNQLCIDEIVENAGVAVRYNSSEPIRCIKDAILEVKKDGFTPDTIIMDVSTESDLYSDPHFRFDYSGETGNFRNQDIGKKIMGLKPYLLTQPSQNATFSGATRHITAIVMDSEKAGGLGIRQDVALEKFSDPKNDLLNLKISMRLDAKHFFKDAICNLRYEG